MIRPSRRLLSVMATTVLVSAVLVLVVPSLWMLWLGMNALLCVGVVLDAARMPLKSEIALAVQAPRVLGVGHEEQMPVRVSNANRRPSIDVRIRAEASGAALGPSEERYTLQSGQSRDLTVPLRGMYRGTGHLLAIRMETDSPWGLTSRVIVYDDVLAPLRVGPDVAAVRIAALRWANTKQYLEGMKLQRHIGDGREFDAHKEYQPGMDHRSIDWRVSARMRALHVREFREEKNHNVVVALDCGRVMSAPNGELTGTDHALNGALHLAYSALQGGDRLSFFAFDNQVRTWMSPVGGLKNFQRVLDQSHAIPYSRFSTNFTAPLTELALSLKRRSIIILLTDFDDETSADELLDSVRALTAKHLVLVITLRNEDILALRDGEISSFDDVTRAVSAQTHIDARERIHRELRVRGVRSFDLSPTQLAPALLTQYHDVKRRGLI